MEKALSIDDLLATAVALRSDLDEDPRRSKRYAERARQFGKSYKEITGTSEYSPKRVDAVLARYRAMVDSGERERSVFQLRRRIAADIEDVAEYGTVSNPPIHLGSWKKPRNQLSSPVPESIRSDPNNVVGLSLASLDEMRRVGISEASLKNYFHTGFPKVIEYFRERGSTSYSDELIDRFLEEFDETAKAGPKYLRLSALHIKSMHHEGRLHARSDEDDALERARKGPYGSIVSEYDRWRKAEGIKESSIRIEVCYILRFLRRLRPDGADDLRGVTREQVRDALEEAGKEKSPEYVRRMLTPIRCFARFMEDRHPECPALTMWIDRSPRVVRRRPIEGYTPEQAEAIIDAVDVSSKCGKRDLAVIRLARSVGLRSCDIRSLELGDIDWRAGEVRIVQEKTGVPIALPLDAATGEAIADYLLAGRRESSSRKVFLTETGPIKPLTGMAVQGIVRKAVRAAFGPEHKGRCGVHAFRRGLGASLVEAGVAMPDVADVLGHRSVYSTNPYVALSTERLRMCCAGLDNVPIGGRANDGRA